ncbi:hypothetical protein CL633_02765 [bacterium]|nr:hypothetical protein [bacterium]
MKKNILAIDPGGTTVMATIKSSPWLQISQYQKFNVDSCHFGTFKKRLRTCLSRADIVLVEEFTMSKQQTKTAKTKYYREFSQAVYMEVLGETNENHLIVIPTTFTGVLRKNLRRIWPLIGQGDLPRHLYSPHNDHVLDCIILALQYEFPLLVKMILSSLDEMGLTTIGIEPKYEIIKRP